MCVGLMGCEHGEVRSQHCIMGQLTCSTGLKWREVCIYLYIEGHYPKLGFFHLKTHIFKLLHIVQYYISTIYFLLCRLKITT
jgi:hypothetical protein